MKKSSVQRENKTPIGLLQWLRHAVGQIKYDAASSSSSSSDFSDCSSFITPSLEFPDRTSFVYRKSDDLATSFELNNYNVLAQDLCEAGPSGASRAARAYNGSQKNNIESVTNQNRENRFCDSPRRTSRVEKDLQRPRTSDSIKKMMPDKFHMEAVPWTQVDGAKNQVKVADATMTVYGKLQKRLSQLEFGKTSGKDLRALKQILEAMEQMHQLISKDDDNKTLNSTNFMQRSDHPIPSATSPSSNNFRSSSMVVMKAAAAPVFTDPVYFSPKNVALPNVKVGSRVPWI